MKSKKVLFAVVLLLFLVVGAVIYHNYAIENSYTDGYVNGYNNGKNTGYNQGFESGKSEGYTNGYNKGYTYYEEIKDEYLFFHRYAVITTTTGKKYHRYGCYHIKGRSFYIFNIEAAEGRGYTPCLDCYG